MQKLISHLEMFLKTNVALLLPGDPALKNYADAIPITWKEILLTDISVSEAIGKVWQPILPYLQHSAKITRQITDIGLVVSLAQPAPIGLIYIFRHIKSDEIFSWLGYAPIRFNQLRQFKERFGLPLPASYQAFCTVHNGLLRDGWISSGPRPVEKLRLFEVAQGKDGQKQQLLAFSGDGTGNEQCYHLHLPADINDYLTVDWDHESEQYARCFPSYTLRRTGYATDNGLFYNLRDQLNRSSVLINQNGTINSNHNYFFPFGGNRGGAVFNRIPKAPYSRVCRAQSSRSC